MELPQHDWLQYLAWNVDVHIGIPFGSFWMIYFSVAPGSPNDHEIWCPGGLNHNTNNKESSHMSTQTANNLSIQSYNSLNLCTTSHAVIPALLSTSKGLGQIGHGLVMIHPLVTDKLVEVPGPSRRLHLSHMLEIDGAKTSRCESQWATSHSFAANHQNVYILQSI